MSDSPLLVPFDPEPECTFRIVRRKLKQFKASTRKANEIEEHAVEQARNPILMANDRDRNMRDYANTIFNEYNPGIVRPEIQAPQFELKPLMFQMLQTIGKFSVQATEDPHLHLKNFLEVSDSFNIAGVTAEALRMRLFPFSLRDSARAWLNSMSPGSIATNELTEKFLMKYFPPTRNAQYRNEIIAFRQKDKSLTKALERFKHLCESAHIMAYL